MQHHGCLIVNLTITGFAFFECVFNLFLPDDGADQLSGRLQALLGDIDHKRRATFVLLGASEKLIRIDRVPFGDRFDLRIIGRRIAVAEIDRPDNFVAGPDRNRIDPKPAAAKNIDRLALLNSGPGSIGPAGFMAEPAAAGEGLLIRAFAA